MTVKSMVKSRSKVKLKGRRFVILLSKRRTALSKIKLTIPYGTVIQSSGMFWTSGCCVAVREQAAKSSTITANFIFLYVYKKKILIFMYYSSVFIFIFTIYFLQCVCKIKDLSTHINFFFTYMFAVDEIFLHGIN